jgi:hypothetical protein
MQSTGIYSRPSRQKRRRDNDGGRKKMLQQILSGRGTKLAEGVTELAKNKPADDCRWRSVVPSTRMTPYRSRFGLLRNELRCGHRPITPSIKRTRVNSGYGCNNMNMNERRLPDLLVHRQSSSVKIKKGGSKRVHQTSRSSDNYP